MIAPYWQQLEHELAGTGLSMYPALAWISATALFVAILALVKGVIGMGRKILRMAARSGPARPELSAKAARRTGSWFWRDLQRPPLPSVRRFRQRPGHCSRILSSLRYSCRPRSGATRA
ncbi:hypothetical protein [Acidiferrobacter sp.]|uniref:hypothetical protein n=1 Tax=Acidiferrobacter sp. TaxID=1872107 RepID=UPI002609A828|nr:hypothetical protein [Acidiferrobacter sp.]